MPLEPFSIHFPHEALDDLRDRLVRTRWRNERPGSGWEYVFDCRFLQEICDYWRERFNWKAEVKKVWTLHHYRYVSDGIGIHFIHERGKGPAPIPIILTHGWPGSFLEMMRIIPLLTDPASHGADHGDSFDVVVPSLPGYGFSDRPTCRGMNLFRTAELWAGMMEELGYVRFAAQGGDLGAGVTTILRLRHAHRMIGIHLNHIPGSFRPHLEPGTKLNGTEEEFLAGVVRWSDESGAYAHVQRTRPQTAAYGLNDSPAGLAAWILEKFRELSYSHATLYNRFSRHDLLANVTLYWMTETIHSSFRLYFDGRK